MCGLVGLVLKTNSGGNSWDADFIQQLIFVDTLRGEDSTGVALFKNDGETTILKEASDGPTFLKTPEWKALRSEFITSGKALLGHNRKKTVGKISDETAHPFVYQDRYVFMHNGTLTNDKYLLDNLDTLTEMGVEKWSKPTTDVDSEILGQMLVPFGDDPEMLQKQLSMVSGAYACVWLDRQKEKVYIVRNKERTLYYCNTPIGFIYASEPWFLYLAGIRNKVEIKDLKPVEEDTLYEIDVSDTFGKTCTVKETKLEVKKSFPLPTQTSTTVFPGGKGQTSGNHSAKGGVNKQSLRKFRRDWLGKRITFWVDDYSPSSPKSVNCWWLLGLSPQFDELNHTVSYYITGIDERDLLEQYDGKLLSGTIDHVYSRGQDEMVNITLTDVRIVPPSTPLLEHDTKNSPIIH